MEFIGSTAQTVFGGMGLDTPAKRFAAATVAGTLAEFLAKPSYAFFEDGRMRPWRMPFVGSGDASNGETYTPIGFFPVLSGLVVGLFF